jgi:hypothetical protein
MIKATGDFAILFFSFFIVKRAQRNQAVHWLKGVSYKNQPQREPPKSFFKSTASIPCALLFI